jgi:hypothetical protein
MFRSRGIISHDRMLIFDGLLSLRNSTTGQGGQHRTTTIQSHTALLPWFGLKKRLAITAVITQYVNMSSGFPLWGSGLGRALGPWIGGFAVASATRVFLTQSCPFLMRNYLRMFFAVCVARF